MRNNLQKGELTEGIVWKTLLQFALPIFLGTFFQSLYTMADAVIIGKFAGKEALASIESVYTLTKIPINFFVGLSSGATIIISQYYGGRKYKAVSEACHNAVLFSLIGGIVLSVSGCILSSFAMKIIRVPSPIVDDANGYISIFFSGLAVSIYLI